MPHHDKVFRTDLSPVSFLRRSAYVYPDKLAVVHGARRYTYRHSRSASIGWPRACAPPACRARPGRVPLPEHPAAAGGALRRARRGRHPGGDQHPPRLATRSATSSSHSGARFLFVDAELEPLIEPLDLSGIDVVAHRRHRQRRRSLRGLPGRRLAGAGGELARRRGGDDLDQLHLGHDRPARRA